MTIFALLLAAAFAQPAPKPVPSDGPAAKITDKSGKPFPASIDGVRVLYFYADKSIRDPGNEVFWQVWPKSYQKGADKFPPGVGTMFCVPVGDDKVTLDVQQIVAKTVGKDAQSNLGTITVRVNNGPRPPPVPPDPEPKPPTPTSDIFKTSRDEAMKIPAASRLKASAVATALRKAQQTVMDNAMTQPASIMSLIRSKTNAAIGEATDDWKPWGIAVALKMKDAGPTTPAAWAKLIEQAAAGLEAVQ